MRLGEFYELRLRKAMSVMEAKEALGFKPSDEPTKEDIAKAYKNLAFKHHPDKGGDPAKMVELNVAKDVLEGKQRPSGPSGPSTSYQPQTYTTQKREPPKPIHVSFQEAAQKASVPTTGVEWKFKTDTGYGHVREGSHSVFVVYGTTKDKHVFVYVSHYSDRGSPFEPKDIDEYDMAVMTAPISQELSSVAPNMIRKLWNLASGTNVKNYNAKVQLLPEGTKFNDRLSFFRGRSIAFKVAVQELGGAVPDKWKGKVDIDLEMGEEMKYPDNHPRLKWCYKCCRPVLVVNGKEYKLGDKAAEIVHANKLYDKMWGKKYWYCGDRTSKKRLNKVKNAKQILTFFANICEKHGEPKELVEALRAAADQAK
jgi:hypothetical protein